MIAVVVVVELAITEREGLDVFLDDLSPAVHKMNK